jgi:hypothetical protein
MLQSTFDSLPIKAQAFITATKIPLAHVNVNDFDCVPTPKIYFKKPYALKNSEKTAIRFSLRDADRLRLWWVN